MNASISQLGLDFLYHIESMHGILCSAFYNLHRQKELAHWIVDVTAQIYLSEMSKNDGFSNLFWEYTTVGNLTGRPNTDLNKW